MFPSQFLSFLIRIYLSGLPDQAMGAVFRTEISNFTFSSHFPEIGNPCSIDSKFLADRMHLVYIASFPFRKRIETLARAKNAHNILEITEFTYKNQVTIYSMPDL